MGKDVINRSEDIKDSIVLPKTLLGYNMNLQTIDDYILMQEIPNVSIKGKVIEIDIYLTEEQRNHYLSKNDVIGEALLSVRPITILFSNQCTIIVVKDLTFKNNNVIVNNEKANLYTWIGTVKSSSNY